MALSVRIRRLLVLLLAGTVGATAWPSRADTCSYNYDCRGSMQCAALMGRASGTRTFSGTATIQMVPGDANSIRTVPVNKDNCELARRIGNNEGFTSPCSCTAGDEPGATASNGFQLKSTGSATGDLVNDAAQLWILQNIKNPYTMTFAQNFTQSFLTSYIQGQKQREQIEANIRQQQEVQAEQAREAEQRRIDAIFARLNTQLKLSGIDTQLALKTGGDPTQLAMKLSGSDSDGLAFKFGGVPSAPAAVPQPDPASVTGGLKLKLSDDPAAGNAAAPDTMASANATPAMGIPGLPGIFLNDIPPAKSPEVAVAALSMNGPERDIAEDAALQAAQKNPALTASSDDPFVQDFQQQAREYDEAKKAQQAALDKAAEAQGHVQADQTALNYASNMVQTSGATAPQSEAMARLQSVVGEEEDIAMAAEVGFDKAGAEADVKREEAAISLASLAPPTMPTQTGLVMRQVEDEPLTMAVAASAVTQPSGSTPFFGLAVAKPAVQPPAPQPANPSQTSSVQTGNGLPVLSPTAKPEIFPSPEQPGGKPAFSWESVGQCLAQSAPASQSNPSLEQLKQQLEQANQAYDQLLKSMEEQSEEWKQWNKKWREAGRNSAIHLLDGIIDKQLDGAVEAAKVPIDEEAETVRKELDTVVEEYRDYHYAMAETHPMSGVTTEGAVIFTPDQLEQYKQLSMADFKARLIPLNSQRMALVSRLTELEQEKRRADKLLSVVKLGRDYAIKQIDKSDEEKKPEPPPNDLESPFSSMNGLLNWLQKDETSENLHQFLEISFTTAKLTGVGLPIAEAGESALELFDVSYDVSVEIVAFQTMRQTDQNNAKFKLAQQSLQKRIAHLTAEMSCYSQAGKSTNAEAVR